MIGVIDIEKYSCMAASIRCLVNTQNPSILVEPFTGDQIDMVESIKRAGVRAVGIDRELVNAASRVVE